MPRLGGAFPLSTPDTLHGGGVVTLASGQAFYPPQGNYMWGPGNQTCLQWFDPTFGSWRTIQQPDTGPTNFNTDGYNWRLINLSGVVIGANITNAGAGGTNGIGAAATGVTVAFAAPSGAGNVTALAYPIVGGSVPAPSIVAAGSGFLVPPVILCDPPPYGGVQATFTCALNAAGGIASVTQQQAGAGYTTVPNFYIIPQTQFYQGAPSGGVAAAPNIPPGLIDPTMLPLTTTAPGFNTALASAASPGAKLAGNTLTGSGTLTAIVMYVYGSGYTGTTIPAVTITGCGAAAATALMSMCMTGFSSLAGGAGYGTGAPPNFETSLGLIASGVLNATATPRAARGVTTVAAGAVNSVTIEDPGFGFQKVPAAAVLNTSALATGQATFTVTCGGQVDTNVLQAPVYA